MAHRLALGWLLLALLLGPALGRMHQIVHGLGGGARPAPAHGADSQGLQALQALQALFAGHGSADCQVLDQHTVGGTAPVPLLALAHAPPHAAPVHFSAALPVARRPTPFQARAPPGSR